MTRPQDQLIGRRDRIVSLRPMTVCRSIADKHAALALVDGYLAAVLVRLDDEAHREFRGKWFVEIGFGPFDVRPPPLFETLTAVEEWIAAVATTHLPGPSAEGVEPV